MTHVVCTKRLNGIVVKHLKKHLCVDPMRKTLNKLYYLCTLEVTKFARRCCVRNGMWDSVIKTQVLLGAVIYIFGESPCTGVYTDEHIY